MTPGRRGRDDPDRGVGVLLGTYLVVRGFRPAAVAALPNAQAVR